MARGRDALEDDTPFRRPRSRSGVIVVVVVTATVSLRSRDINSVSYRVAIVIKVARKFIRNSLLVTKDLVKKELGAKTGVQQETRQMLVSRLAKGISLLIG